MPELPEVETIKNVLKPILIGQSIKSIDVLRRNTIIGNVSFFCDSLQNQSFIDISRKGKFLIFHLTNDFVILSHLRMEGKFFELNENDQNTKYSRVVFHLSNDKKVCYDDSRCFGLMKLSKKSDYQKEKELSSLGPEPFEIDDPTFLCNKTNKSNIPIKTTLLNQFLIAGLGNIYVDEVLFKSKIHPLTLAKFITKNEWFLIIDNAKKILNKAIKEGGSTIRSYHPGKNIDGNFQVHLLAYGKKNEKCSICHHPMRFIKVNGRGTTFCPHCQKKKGLPISVAIFGLIGSGKSSVLKSFSNNGFITKSCDDIVHSLYQKTKVAEMISKRLGLSFDNEVDANTLRTFLLKYPKKKKILEGLIHPLVKEEVQLFQKKYPLTVIEVPLLFEAKMESMFDVLVAVDVNDDIRLKRLKKRDNEKSNDLETINSKDNRFHINKLKADYIIKNNGSKEDLENSVQDLINKLLNHQN